MPWPALVGVALLPYIAFKAGSWIIRQFTGRGEVLARLTKLPEGEKKHLNERINGYDVDAVRRLFGVIDEEPSLLDREREALLLDLIFPLFYAAAFAVGLLVAWRAWTGSSGGGWFLLLAAVIYLLADWTENLVHLRQLRRYRQDPEALESSWVQVASRATMVKLIFFIGCQGLIILLILSIFMCWIRSYFNA